MAGRDVRRLAARASTMTFESKRDAVARIAAGADAAGVTDIYIAEEPFRVATTALQWMSLKARVNVVKTQLRHDATDTEAAVRAFLGKGVGTVVSLGGDGTNRAIARTASDIDLIPLSTGTNNVFPVLAEPTVAGIAAGLSARGELEGSGLKSRCKVLHVEFSDGRRDVALVDAALLADDVPGNFLPFDPGKLRQILLTRAEPDAIGMSPVGGYLEVVTAQHDHGLLVHMGAGREVAAPLSPGLFKSVSVASVSKMPFDVPVHFRSRGVLALDGDRDHKLGDGRTAHVTVRRDGPRVVDIGAAMRHAVQRGLLPRATP